MAVDFDKDKFLNSLRTESEDIKKRREMLNQQKSASEISEKVEDSTQISEEKDDFVENVEINQYESFDESEQKDQKDAQQSEASERTFENDEDVSWKHDEENQLQQVEQDTSVSNIEDSSTKESIEKRGRKKKEEKESEEYEYITVRRKVRRKVVERNPKVFVFNNAEIKALNTLLSKALRRGVMTRYIDVIRAGIFYLNSLNADEFRKIMDMYGKKER